MCISDPVAIFGHAVGTATISTMLLGRQYRERGPRSDKGQPAIKPLADDRDFWAVLFAVLTAHTATRSRLADPERMSPGGGEGR
jgi:hypothetical protein